MESIGERSAGELEEHKARLIILVGPTPPHTLPVLFSKVLRTWQLHLVPGGVKPFHRPIIERHQLISRIVRTSNDGEAVTIEHVLLHVRIRRAYRTRTVDLV